MHVSLTCASELDEAERFIESMPMQPDSSVYGSLLGDCRDYANQIWVPTGGWLLKDPMIGPGFLSYGMHKKSSLSL